jgi:hypothetical protein
MGTDMHLFVEKFVDGKWQYVHAPGKPQRVATREISPIDWYRDAGYQSYETMALLANVRNYDGIPPIAAWRGMPTDASAESIAAHDWAVEIGVNWVTVEEIKAYDFEQQITIPARMVSSEEIERRGWSAEVHSPHVETHSRGPKGDVPEGYTLQAFPVRELVVDFLGQFLPTIENECRTSPDKIRLIMWFDC